MDAFYAAVEMRDAPELRNQPVVIGANPQGGHGRGVVSTANYLARSFGIRSAMPISQAYALCPHAVFITPRFHAYKEASEKVMAVLVRYAGAIEVVGMDEAYLGMSHLSWQESRSVARSLQAAVRRVTGLSCSIGIAPTKSIAKVASDFRKPHGVTVVTPDQVGPFLAPLPVRALNGCGPKTAARLVEEAILTIQDLRDTPRPRMAAMLGSQGEWLWDVAHGLDPRQVEPRSGRKSLGAERTFARDVEAGAAMDSAHTCLEELLSNIAKDGGSFSTLTVKLRTRGFVTKTRAHTWPVALGPQSAPVLAAAVCSLLAEILPDEPIRLVGVRLSGLCGGPKQAHLEGAAQAIGYRPRSAVRVSGAIQDRMKVIRQAVLARHAFASWQALPVWTPVA